MIAPALLAVLLLASGQGRPLDESSPPAPFKRAGGVVLEFRGPGRDAPDPQGDTELVLGWFGPADPDHGSGGDPWRGAVLAVEDIEGSGGSPVRLVPGWSDSPWTAGAAEVARMVYVDGARAIVGPMDGASTHLAEQVALKARVTLLSSGSTDATVNQAGVPWMFSCLPTDAAQAPVLAHAVARRAGGHPVAVAAAAEHDAHTALGELLGALEEQGLVPSQLVEFEPRNPELQPLATRLVEGRPGVVVILAPSAPAARLVVALRVLGFEGTLVGSAPLARAAFQRVAGPHADGVIVPRLWQVSPRWDAFARAYEARWGETPDHSAAQAYDAVRMLRDAAERGGRNRARLRDAVRELSPWEGAAGVVRWDALGRNERPPGLATWKDGRLLPLVPTPGMRESRLRRCTKHED